MNRREALAAGAIGFTAVAAAKQKDGPINPKGGLKVTKIETFLVQPRFSSAQPPMQRSSWSSRI